MQLSKLLQKRVEMPKSENSKGEFKIDERVLDPKDIMVYIEFNPRSFEKFWRKYQPTGNLVFSELPANVQVIMLNEVLKQVGSELGYHFVQGESGEGEEQFFDGILTRILADEGVVKATCESPSMIARLRSVWEKTAEKVRDQPNFTFLMSSADFDKYDNELTESASQRRGSDLDEHPPIQGQANRRAERPAVGCHHRKRSARWARIRISTPAVISRTTTTACRSTRCRPTASSTSSRC